VGEKKEAPEEAPQDEELTPEEVEALLQEADRAQVWEDGYPDLEVN